MSPLIKLAVGAAGTVLIAQTAYQLVRSPVLSDLGTRSAEVMAANGITDGRANWVTDNGWTWRVARLSGTADAATRARTRDAVAALRGVNDAVWDDEADGQSPAIVPVSMSSIKACQTRVDAIITDYPIDFEPSNATPDPAARQLLDAVAQVLATCSGARVAITVQTGTAGAAAVNMALSQARADAIRAALVERGIGPAVLTATGTGEAAMTRVAFRLTPRQERPS